MRFDGTLKSWNAERGFGFITPRQGGQDIFVHISVFPRDGREPREGESLSFEVETTPEGKKRAIRVARPGASPVGATPAAYRRSSAHRGTGLGRAVVGLALAAVLGWYAYAQYGRQVMASNRSTPAVQAGTAEVQTDTAAVGNFRCDGRTRCSQMTSCAEATFFLKNCAGVQMDGNHDGVPCEQQWCTSSSAR